MNKKEIEIHNQRRKKAIAEMFNDLGFGDKLTFRISDKKDGMDAREYAESVVNRSFTRSDNGFNDYAVFDINSDVEAVQESNVSIVKNAIKESGLSTEGIFMSDNNLVNIPVKFMLDQWGVKGERHFHVEMGSSLMSMLQVACSSIPIDSNDFIQRLNADTAKIRNNMVNSNTLVGKEINARYIYEAFSTEMRILLKTYSISLNEYNAVLQKMSEIIKYGNVVITSIKETDKIDESGSMYVRVGISEGSNNYFKGTIGDYDSEEDNFSEFNFTVSRDVIRDAFESYETDIKKFG